MSAIIAVPFRGDGISRTQNWDFCREWWEVLGLPIVQGDSPSGEVFDITKARNAAVRNATEEHPSWEVLLMTDADVLLDSHHAATTAMQIAHLTDKYVVAHSQIMYLSPQGTKRIFAGVPAEMDHVEDMHRHTWETCFAFTRKTWEAVGGFDPRFRGFGHQVEAFFHACKTLFGADRVLAGTCYHFWHPYGADQFNPHLPVNRELIQRYWDASGDRDGMLELLAEYVVVT